MCKYDEAFTEREMLEETGYCNICKLDCQNAVGMMKAIQTDNSTILVGNNGYLVIGEKSSF